MSIPGDSRAGQASAATPEEWFGLGGRRRRRWLQFTWRELLWGLLLPEKMQRVLPTAAGLVLVAMTVAIGLGAYNTGNNILFITLALLLASLILSGVLAWLNFTGTEWRLRAPPPFRVGQVAEVSVEVRNRKRVLPTYAAWFDLGARQSGQSTRLFLQGRLDAGAVTRLDWSFRPARRGVETLALSGVGSQFPFGFLSKTVGVVVRREVRIWPARVACRFTGVVAARFQLESEVVARPGLGLDLLGVRRYRAGDSHRHIHWKASARVRQLMVRQHATEGAPRFALWVDSAAATWPHPEQFELLCSLAATLAEDLFRAGRLESVVLDGEAPAPILGVRDVETWLDRLAVLEPKQGGPARGTPRVRAALVTFAPDGERGICARLGHEVAVRV